MTQLLQNAVYGTVLILAVAALRGVLRDRLLPEARLALWAVCLFRLFTPIAPTSALSFWRLFRQTWEQPVSVPAAPAAPTVATVPTIPMVPTTPTASIAPAAPTGTEIPWGAVLAAVWIAVGAVLAVRYALAYVRTRRAVNRAAPLGREDARYAALPKCARLREGPLDGAPLTFGVVRPTVVLTPGLDGAELACVLAHEGVHARRRDNLWHYAAAAALTVFWWDPAVWLMARLIRRDVELSCDRAAVRRLGAERRAEYARALVTLSTQAEGGAFCHGFGPKRTEERIIAIMKYKKTTIFGIALTLALVLAVSVGFASNPAQDVPDEEDAASSAPSDALSNDLPVNPADAEPEYVRYNPNDPDSNMLEEYKAMLAQLVAQGMCTQETADEMLAHMELLIERAKNGEIKNLMFKKPADGEVINSLVICYIKVDGNPSYEYPVTLVKEPAPAPDDAGEADNQTDAEPQPDDVIVIYDPDDPDSNVLEEYKALLERVVAQGRRTQAEADKMLADMEALIERAKNGEVRRVAFNKQANGEVTCIVMATDFIGADGLPETEPLPDDVIVIYDPDDPDSNVLEEYKALLERVVAQGRRTQAEADKMLADMEALIERAKNGEVRRVAFNKQANGEVTCIVMATDFIGAG